MARRFRGRPRRRRARARRRRRLSRFYTVPRGGIRM